MCKYSTYALRKRRVTQFLLELVALASVKAKHTCASVFDAAQDDAVMSVACLLELFNTVIITHSMQSSITST
jgi:hypothetical protein